MRFASARYGTAIYGGSRYGINEALAELPGPRWDLIAMLPNGQRLGDLAKATKRKFTFRLTSPSSLEWSMLGSDPAAALVDELATDVIAHRNGVLLFRGRVSVTGDELDGDAHTVKAAAGDYRWLLEHRGVWSPTPVTFTGVEQAEIAWQLIAATQALTAGNLGISQGLGSSTGTARDRTYEPGKRLSEAIDQLADVAGGFDWDISPDLGFNVYFPGRGVHRDFVAHYGATITKVDRDVDPSEFANAIRHSGADGLAPQTREVADLATRREGRWEAQVGDTDVSVPSTLAEKADWLLSERAVVRPSYTVTLKPGAWDGPATLWLGDTCRLVIRKGRLDVNTLARVFEIEVAPGDHGGETVKVTFDRPRSTSVRRASRDAARIDQLERR